MGRGAGGWYSGVVSGVARYAVPGRVGDESDQQGTKFKSGLVIELGIVSSFSTPPHCPPIGKAGATTTERVK